MRADQRAEIEPCVEGYSVPSLIAIPRVLRSGRLYLATALAIMGAADMGSVQAAGKECRNTQLLVVGVGYVNNPLEPNRPKQSDTVDLVVGSPEFGIAVIDRINDPKDPNSARTEIARGNLVNRGLYTSQVFRLSGLSNTLANDGSEAMEVAFYFDNDPAQVNPQTGKSEKPSVKVVAKCGFTVPVWGGRVAPLSEVERVLNNSRYEFRTVASVVNEAMRAVTGRSAGLGPEKALQEESRRAVREFFDQEKAKEKAKAAPTPTVAPAATPSPTPSPTAPPAKESPSPTATATATPGPGGGGTANRGDGSIFILSGAGEVLKFGFDLPAKAVDLITEPDTQNPVRGVVNIGGLLLAAGLLFNHPSRFRNRAWNTVRWPDRTIRHVPGRPGIWAA